MGVKRRAIHVDGVVQGVGFRPFIYSLAIRNQLTGWVLNSSSGVDIEIQGEEHVLDVFQQAITHEAPPLARIQQIESYSCLPLEDEESFTIRHSLIDSGVSLLPPDVATCPDCLKEILTPTDRRYRYPFTNCTNCGPRYTIIEHMPYDRSMTTMRQFEMCPACRAEYENPLDRRYHAQPNACPVCGPKVELLSPSGIAMPMGDNAVDIIAQAAALLRAGSILAVKGIGGFHLACDATNEDAVRRLRERKSRPDKPFAVMMATIDQIANYCEISAGESSLLGSASAPIVLLRQKPDSGIALNTAPHTDIVGVMLPYTPLHHLLLHDTQIPLVMTSGNLSDMPVIKDNDQALVGLAGIADAFLFHNRDIHVRCDDAVWWVEHSAQSKLPFTHQPLRRSRGDAPYPISLNRKSLVQLLACGAEMKNTFCLLREDQAFLSQHIGEINSLESLEYFQSTYDHLRALFKVEPQIIAHDLHPEYLTTKLAYQLANTHGLECVAVQHHHAHIAACLAEHGTDRTVIGLALDGTGYGPDGAIWGGEVLIADVKQFQRVCHLEYLPLPGGDAAIHRPYRIAWSYLHSTMGLIPDLPGLANTPIDERTIVLRQLERNINTPLTSSAGRLFDAVAAMLGVCTVTTYEGQAAIMLETCARRATDLDIGVYTTSITPDSSIKIGEMLREISEDAQNGRPVSAIAMQFHVTLAHVLANAVERAHLRTGLNDVVLSGGVFQNRLLLNLVRRRLVDLGFNILWHQKVPANDGGISLGQAVIAMHSQFSS